MCIRVDFPEPLFPTMARVSPATMLSETSSSAWKRLSPLPYHFDRWRTSRIGAGAPSVIVFMQSL